MKVRVTNNSEAPQGIEKAGGGYVFVAAGETRSLDAANPALLYRLSFLEVEALEAQVPDMPASLAEKVTPKPAEPAPQPRRNPFDHDGDGKPGGSRRGRSSTAAKGARRRRKAASK